MRAIPIPDSALRRTRALGIYADRIVIGEDDPTRDDVRRALLAAGARLWLNLDGAEVPWSIDVAESETADAGAIADLLTAAQVAAMRRVIARGGPYLLGKWTDCVVHADPCDCDEDNEDVGDRCMDASDWSYAVLADEGGFPPSLVLKLPRRPPEADEDDGTRVLPVQAERDALTAERDALQARLDEATATIDGLLDDLQLAQERLLEFGGRSS